MNPQAKATDVYCILYINAALSGYITTLKNKQKLDVSSELFFKVVIGNSTFSLCVQGTMGSKVSHC
jgi:hypothetical protein